MVFALLLTWWLRNAQVFIRVKEATLQDNCWAALDLEPSLVKTFLSSASATYRCVSLVGWGAWLPHLLTPYPAQHIPESYGFFFWVVSPILSFFSMPTVSALVQVLTMSHLHYYKNAGETCSRDITPPTWSLHPPSCSASHLCSILMPRSWSRSSAWKPQHSCPLLIKSHRKG